MEGYQKLDVYAKAYGLVLKVYSIAKSLPKEEMYALSSQMRRASVGIPLNIAEGYSRKANPKEYKQFILIAQGSASEMLVLMDLCKDLGYIDNIRHQEMQSGYIEVKKMLNGVLRSLG